MVQIQCAISTKNGANYMCNFHQIGANPSNGTWICTILVQILVHTRCNLHLDLHHFGANGAWICTFGVQTGTPKPSFEGVTLGHFEGVELNGFEGVGCLKLRGLLARDRGGKFLRVRSPPGRFFSPEKFLDSIDVLGTIAVSRDMWPLSLESWGSLRRLFPENQGQHKRTSKNRDHDYDNGLCL